DRISVGLTVGALVGYVTAITLDAAVFAREPATPEAASASRARRIARLVPMLSLARSGATIGIGGAM
ncbi:hypothetical protein, partial [Klebsiella pneumoniae]|uniref:hypothetical protein n=1 Tax=Klebsiella pneumoniae TaxID=573 RepID=UPI003EE2F913